MQRYILGECALTLRLTPVGTWMVRGQTIDESFKDSRGVPRSRDVLQPLRGPDGQPCLPASSLKGVLRATAERVLRSMHPTRSLDLIPLADDPFVHSRTAEGDMAADVYRAWLAQRPRGAIADSELIEWNEQHRAYTDEIAPDQRYQILSAASQLFGATVHAGLLSLTDAQPDPVRLQRRSHVAIDRLTGGVGEGPFIEELVPAAVPLESRLKISNFALWHLALLALTVQEFNAGYSAIGGGTRKGQGQVQMQMTQIECVYSQAAGHRSTGIVSAQGCLAARDAGADVPAAVRAIEQPETCRLLPELQATPARGWRDDGLVRFVVPDAQVERLFQEAVRKAWLPWTELLVSEGET
jgi:CRISPR/Cas system CSM-associated protein Csm3 (group 7 of RAMP superfamily)